MPALEYLGLFELQLLVACSVLSYSFCNTILITLFYLPKSRCLIERVLFLIFYASSLWVSETRKRCRSKYLKNKTPDQTTRLQSAATLDWLSNAERMTQNEAFSKELGSGLTGKVLSCCSARCGRNQISREQDPRSHHASAVHCNIVLFIIYRDIDSKWSF
jgi:hypothetical protein